MSPRPTRRSERGSIRRAWNMALLSVPGRSGHERISAEFACPAEGSPASTRLCSVSAVPGALPIGSIASGTEGTSVSLDLAEAGMTLKPGTTYHYRVIAARACERRYARMGRPDRRTRPHIHDTPAGNAPVIESVSLSHLTPTDATLEAKINTEGLATTYQFYMWSSLQQTRSGCEYPGRSLCRREAPRLVREPERQPRPQQRRRDVEERREYGCG